MAPINTLSNKSRHSRYYSGPAKLPTNRKRSLTYFSNVSLMALMLLVFPARSNACLSVGPHVDVELLDSVDVPVSKDESVVEFKPVGDVVEDGKGRAEEEDPDGREDAQNGDDRSLALPDE